MEPDNKFASFGLDTRLVDAIGALGFEAPTPIQTEAMPVLMEGHDVIGRARTGSGKTAAFGLPLLDRVKDGGRDVRAILLTPTRELCNQVSEALRSYADKLPIRIFAVYGGTPYEPQLRALRSGVSVVVGTPGRVLDLIRGGHLRLQKVEVVVLDEADEMLRMGFIDDVSEILSATPDTRQTMLFSATMPGPIRAVANKHLREPKVIQVEEGELTTQHIEQRWMRVPARYRVDALCRVLQAEPRGTALVFARTRAETADVADELSSRGLAVDALHGDLNQGARERVLRRLRSKRLDLLIATDVASRGIDVQHVTHVINLELPRDREGYVHRIGRTGRAGRHGVAITFVTPKHKHRMRSLARSLGVDIKEMEVPSDAAIAGRRRERLQAALAEAVEGEMDPARAWLKQVQEKSGLSLEDLAASAVSLLAGDRDVALADPEGSDEGWIRPPSQHDHVVRDPVRSNEVELFFPIGRFRHVRPGDLVGAIANEAGVPGHEIGRITIVDRKSFVGMPREVANAILERHPSLTVRGIEVPVVLAHPRQSHPDGPPRRGFRKEGGGRPRFGGGRSGPPRGPKRGDKRYSK